MAYCLRGCTHTDMYIFRHFKHVYVHDIYIYITYEETDHQNIETSHQPDCGSFMQQFRCKDKCKIVLATHFFSEQSSTNYQSQHLSEATNRGNLLKYMNARCQEATYAFHCYLFVRGSLRNGSENPYIQHIVDIVWGKFEFLHSCRNDLLVQFQQGY